VAILTFMTSPARPLIPIDPGCAVKPQRADARRNRERILKAARAVFGSEGIDAQIDDVAKRAKVGVGTVYRHFPTKEALLDALVRERFSEIAQFAKEALRHEDAWEGFCELIWRGAERNAEDRAFCDAVAFTDCSEIVAASGLGHMTQDLMRRAQGQGRMRLDATDEDVPIMMSATASVMRNHPSEAWRRHLTIMLDGLRAPAS
jgi:AcrR family transcriptional regulator